MDTTGSFPMDRSSESRTAAEAWVRQIAESRMPLVGVSWGDCEASFLAGVAFTNARVSKLESDLAMARADLLFDQQQNAGTKVLAKDLESACKTGMLRIREQDYEIEILRTYLKVSQDAEKDYRLRMNEAIADCQILCHAYTTDNAPPRKILRRYSPEPAAGGKR